ncbi:unnamed protein product, partial [Durusdinium trenchii]
RPSTSSSDPRNKRNLTSLESLRAQQNAKVLAQQSERMREAITEISELDEIVEVQNEHLDGHSIICLVRFVLSITGVLDFRAGRGWKCLAHLCLAKTLGLAIVLLGMLGSRNEYRFVNLTTNSYSMGVVVSILLLRWGRKEEDSLAVLLGPKEYQLDEYACKRGFLESSRWLASLRALALMTVWALMVASRSLSGYFGRPETGLLPGDLAQDLVSVGSYAAASLGVMGVFYVQLHVSCGLELAVDMFSAHFFDSKDIYSAMEEWNILQALIRCASCALGHETFAWHWGAARYGLSQSFCANQCPQCYGSDGSIHQCSFCCIP